MTTIKSKPEPERSVDLVLEEYKLLVEERRFIMTRYMQAFAVYLTVVGLSIKGIIGTVKQDEQLYLLALVTSFNFIGALAATYFAKMAKHCMMREIDNARLLGFQEPSNHAWGYWVILLIFFTIEIIVCYIVL